MASGNSVSDAEYTLSKLLQMGTVEDYQREFEMLIKRVTIPESLLKSFYISGLKLDLQCLLLRSNPETLDEAFSLARATEARFEDHRLSEGDHKDDMYKLVEVVGTTKVDVPYGNKSVDIMLEVSNLEKKETVSIDTISNQELSADECRCMRESVRCGLVRCFTIGEIQEKAITFQSVLIDDRLGIEMLRLNQLRDRASENKKKKMVVAIQRRLWDPGIKIVFRQHLEDKVVSEGVGSVTTVKSRITIK
ncbi:zinc finger CCCH domain-containing protein 44-like protein [Tanacetum coccineum]|uniref:Zinc finger CCCH domain-containing protein 44-like protein n=1 Tax=Tanacetum coccineum TaxID=301880 RepID=A0ABQ5G3R0_9ASTR